MKYYYIAKLPLAILLYYLILICAGLYCEEGPSTPSREDCKGANGSYQSTEDVEEIN